MKFTNISFNSISLLFAYTLQIIVLNFIRSINNKKLKKFMHKPKFQSFEFGMGKSPVIFKINTPEIIRTTEKINNLYFRGLKLEY